MRIIISSSLNLHKTSIIALDGLQVWSIPVRRECSITTAPWPRITARILFWFFFFPFFFSPRAVCPAGPQGANQMADWVSTVRRGVRRAFSQFTSTIQIVERAAGTRRKTRRTQERSGSTRSARRAGERREGGDGRSLHGRGVCAIFHVSQTPKRDEHDCLY